MLNILGIIAEYNPVHWGHAYQLEAARQQTGCQYIAIAMSGNFCQRGEPALIDKWARAKAAIAIGADIVLEIPARYALQSAEGFGRAGVGLLRDSGATAISFGSESGDLAALKGLADWLDRPQSQRAIRTELQQGASYPKAIEQALTGSPAAPAAKLLTGANNILAVEYLRALAGTGLRPHTVKRQDKYWPASQIRALFATGNRSALAHIPGAARLPVRQGLQKGALFLEDFSQYIFHALLGLGKSGIAALPACSEGLENRIWQALASARSLAELLSLVKTKRYPLTRLQRLLLQGLLRFDRRQSPGFVPYLRVLALGPRGKDLLPTLAGSGLPLVHSPRDIGKLGAAASRAMAKELYAERIYLLAQRLKLPG